MLRRADSRCTTEAWEHSDELVSQRWWSLKRNVSTKCLVKKNLGHSHSTNSRESVGAKHSSKEAHEFASSLTLKSPNPNRKLSASQSLSFSEFSSSFTEIAIMLMFIEVAKSELLKFSFACCRLSVGLIALMKWGRRIEMNYFATLNSHKNIRM